MSLNDSLINSYRLLSLFFHWSFKIIMFELAKFLVDQFEKEVKKMIKQLSVLKSKRRYQLQFSILNHITEKIYELKTKAKTFWKYVKKDRKSWSSHHENERALKKTFSTLSKMIETTQKARNSYEKTLRRISALWESNEKKFARDQFVQLLKSMRRCALRDLNLNDVRRVVSLTIENRLMNFVKEVSTSRKSINKNWIRMTDEKYDSLRIELASCSNSQLTTLSSSLSFVMRSTMSSLVASLEKKKNRKTTFVVFFFSRILTLEEEKKNRRTIFVVFSLSVVLSSIEKKKNQRAISVDLSFDRTSSSFSLSSSSINFESRFVTQSFRSFFSSTLRRIAILFDALMKDVVSLSKAYLRK
jgi:hypothetical protein